MADIIDFEMSLDNPNENIYVTINGKMALILENLILQILILLN